MKYIMTKEAAEYTGTPANYLLNQAKMGHLSYIQPSPKRIMFDRDDLDAWMASWKVVKAIPATA